VDRIQQAASGLIERISEIEASEEQLLSLERKLQELTSQLITLPITSDSTHSAQSLMPA
jgi:hypothetical protein